MYIPLHNGFVYKLVWWNIPHDDLYKTETRRSISGLYVEVYIFSIWASVGVIYYDVHYSTDMNIITYFFFSWRYNPYWGLYFTAL